MTNIPTDLLRTFVAVVDHRSFTRAAHSLGVTQPAVSAQIKRLQYLLGEDIFDRSTQGVSLTPHGEVVVSYARRLLSINDQIVHLGGAGPRPELIIRLATPSDYIATLLPPILARFRERWPAVRFNVSTGSGDALMRQLRSGELDLYVGLSLTQPLDARHSWAEAVVWVRGADTRIAPGQPVPLVSGGEPSIYHRLAVNALRSSGLAWEEVFTGPGLTSLHGAVTVGLGVMPITRRRAIDAKMIICEDTALPALPDAYSGIYLREGGPREAYEQLADDMAAVLHGPSKVSASNPLASAKPAIGMLHNKDSAA